MVVFAKRFHEVLDLVTPQTLGLVKTTWQTHHRRYKGFIPEAVGTCYTMSYNTVPEKYASCITNIQDISIETTPLYSTSSPPSNEINSISLALVLTELAYFAMLFILQLTRAAISVRQL